MVDGKCSLHHRKTDSVLTKCVVKKKKEKNIELMDKSKIVGDKRKLKKYQNKYQRRKRRRGTNDFRKNIYLYALLHYHFQFS